jgi:hypothetical protein
MGALEWLETVMRVRDPGRLTVRYVEIKVVKVDDHFWSDSDAREPALPSASRNPTGASQR